MANSAKDPIYLSINSDVYKNHKSLLLNSQVDMLNSMKHVPAMKKIKDEKLRLKLKLNVLMNSLVEDLDRLDQKLPMVAYKDPQRPPQQMQQQQQQPPVQKIKQPNPLDEKRDEIEKELEAVRDKLRKLNEK